MTDRAGDSILGGLVRGAIAGAAGVWALHEVDKYMAMRGSAATEAATVAARPGGLDTPHILASRAARALGAELDHPEDNAVGLTAGRGFAFGVTVWAVEDEWGAARLDLAGPPTRYPWQAHGRSFVAHVAYGLTVDAVLRVLKGPPR